MVAPALERPHPGATATPDRPPVPPPVDTSPLVDRSMPIFEKEDEIKRALHEKDTIIVMAQPGSGKTTQIPIFVLEELDKIDPKRKILVTQPRRIAAKDISTFVGKGRDSAIGYRLKGDNNVVEGKTKVIFTVDESLFNEVKRDGALSEFAVIMLDEVHLRRKKTDSILSSIKDVQAVRKQQGLPPLKVLITSGTLDEVKFREKFPDAAFIESKGNIQPITPEYAKENIPIERMATETAKVIQDIVVNRKRKGNILVFLPGKGEIRDQRGALEALGMLGVPNVQIVEIQGDMDLDAQQKAISDDGTQKIILATDIAEAAVTPKNTFTVVDWGLVRQNVFDEETGWERLDTIEQTKDGLRQRAGRGARLGPGLYVGMFTEHNYNNRPDFQKPEILRSQLADMVLDIKVMGRDPRNYPYFETPPQTNLELGITTLKKLGALDQREKLTDIGEKMAEFQMDPHFARMLVEAHKRGCLSEVATIVAFLNTKGLYAWQTAGPTVTSFDKKATREKADRAYSLLKDPKSDFLTFLNIWVENNKRPDEAARIKFQEDHYLGQKAMSNVYQMRRDIIKNLKFALDGVAIDEFAPVDLAKGDEVQKAILAGLTDRLLVREGMGSYKSVDGKKSGIRIGNFSTQYSQRPAQVVTAEIFERNADPVASYVQPAWGEWIREVAPYFYSESQSPISVVPTTEPGLTAAQAKMDEAIKKAETPLLVPKPAEPTPPPPKKEQKSIVAELQSIFSEVKAELRKIWEEFKSAFKRK